MSEATPTAAVAVEPTARAHNRGRAVLSALILIVAVLLTPLGAGAKALADRVLDTDEIVQVLGPLATEPQVQDLLVTHVTDAIEEQLDFESITAGIFDGLSQLDLPPRAQAALQLLETPATMGLRALTEQVVRTLVESDQFAAIWQQAVRLSHSQAMALLKNEPDSTLSLATDGTISLQLGPLIDQAKAQLVAQGFTFAQQLPSINKSIPLVQNDALATIQLGYLALNGLGSWLPWLVLVLFIAGITLAQRRWHAIERTSITLAVVFFGISLVMLGAKEVLLATTSPEVVPKNTLALFYEQLVGFIEHGARDIGFVMLIVAFGSWLMTRRHGALATRSSFTHLAQLTAAPLPKLFGTHAVGFRQRVQDWIVPLRILTVAVWALILLFQRPLGILSVVLCLAGTILTLFILEVIAQAGPAEQAEKTTPSTVEV